MFLPFQPTKNQSFKLFFDLTTAPPGTPGSFAISNFNNSIPYISKDGGVAVQTTNPISLIVDPNNTDNTSGGSIIFTASEMNCDSLLFFVSGDGGGVILIQEVIYTSGTVFTGGNGGGATASEIQSYLQANPITVELDLNQAVPKVLHLSSPKHPKLGEVLYLGGA